jgi:hypothetical protein
MKKNGNSGSGRRYYVEDRSQIHKVFDVKL